MFELSEEHRMLKDLVAKFVDQELIPLERAVLAREAAGGKAGLSDGEEEKLLGRCKELGLWALDVPEEIGGANLPAVALMGMNEELGRSCIPFSFPPDSPNLHMLLAVASPEQRKKYMEPYAAGTAKSAIAISEPGAGGDPAGMITRAVRDGDDWVINGRKIWSADGDGRGGEIRCRAERAHRGVDDQGFCHRDGERDHRPCDAGAWGDGDDQGIAAAIDGIESADDADL